MSHSSCDDGDDGDVVVKLNTRPPKMLHCCRGNEWSRSSATTPALKNEIWRKEKFSRYVRKPYGDVSGDRVQFLWKFSNCFTVLNKDRRASQGVTKGVGPLLHAFVGTAKRSARAFWHPQRLCSLE